MRNLILTTALFWFLAAGAPVEADGPAAAEPVRLPDGRIAVSSQIVIDQPGSYVLTRDIHAGEQGIVILASNVTLDLNGFTIYSTIGPGFGIVGVLVENSSHVEIKNGTIFPSALIPLHTAGIWVGGWEYPVEGIVIRDIQIVGPHTWDGIVFGHGQRGIIEGCTIRAIFSGIQVTGADVTIRDNVVASEELAIQVNQCTGCEITRNTLSGSLSIDMFANGVRVSKNTVRSSAPNDYLLAVMGDFNLIEENQLINGKLNFFGQSEGNIYRGNTARGEGAGWIDIGTGNTSHGDNYLPDLM